MTFQNSNPGKYLFAIAAILLLITSSVQAAQISVQTDRSPVAMDETFQLVFTVDGEPDGQPDFSVLNKDFEVLGSSQSRNISIVNGKSSRTTRFLVTVLPRRAGELRVPPVAFGRDMSPQLIVPVQAAGAGAKNSADAGDQSVFMEVSVDKPKPWVQQQVILTVRIYSRLQWREASLSDPQFRGGEVLMQKLGEDRSYQTRRNGNAWQVIERRYALFPQKSGKLQMDALRLNLRVSSGRKQQRSPFGSFNDPFFDDFFSSRSYRTKVVRSKSLTLDVQPVPPQFSGRHWLVAGDVQLKERWSQAPTALKTGEPVTRTLSIVADGVTLGQLPELDLPPARGLRIYPDEPENKEQVTDKGLRSTSSRKFAIIPTHPGSYTLPAVEIKWWNSQAGREETARLPEVKMSVTGGVVPGVPSTNQPATAPAEIPAAAATQGAGTPAPLKVIAGDKRLSGINLWLAAGNLVLLVLWLTTLVLFWRSRKQRPASDKPEESMPGKAEVDMKKAWSALHEAVKAGNAAATKAALLSLAEGFWPDHAPHSLEAMADRVGSPLAGELLNLSRHLYADESVAWDGIAIESGLKTLRPDPMDRGDTDATALKPLYPQVHG
ncbi:BatD family protein [Thiolapillus brandeum]|uniref:DUF7939 domain-containing protein n=1 Tax=Thiolapillus brandeum TaxID=1076588 RepID=A0A7U6JIG6_9GAMM|nr:BatD family protein [Thiolapillus brandeum]BAO44783.1 conserved hypothetical protein [Thiolapillus brandeum]